MVISADELAEKLKNLDLRPSHQRLKILEYLIAHPYHPTVENIYTALHGELPTLSKATIYNTLSAYIAAGIVQGITIEDNEVRYDADTTDHGHFKCRACGRVYDFEVKPDEIPLDGLDGFRIERKGIYFKGICRECLQNSNETV